MEISLKQKHAVICGSSQGIGKAIAVGMAALGATVTLIARNEESLKAAVADLDTAAGQQHDFIAADFSRPDEVEAKIQAYVADHEVHILVNNTGGPPGGPITDAKVEEFHAAFNAHLICNHILAKAVVPGMKKAGHGRIINIISTSVKQPLAGLGVSNTIRGAVASWSKTMANELGQFGITVNNVLPGATETQRLTSILERKSEKSGKSVEEVAAGMKAEVPLKRFAAPKEVANAAIFLSTPAAAYISGVSLAVDAGEEPVLCKLRNQI